MRTHTMAMGTMAMGLALSVLAGTAAQAEMRTTVVAGGCFWCVEADFEKVAGVTDVVSGFAGGTVADPTYEDVVAGGTGHYEAAQITYDDSKLSYAQLVAMFLRSVDPTDAGGQFCDRGDSYRTAIFTSDPGEKAAAEAAIAAAQTQLGQTVVTPVLPAQTFYPADAYHQDYYKSQDVVLTRGGPKRKANAYTFYRDGCGRDDRLRALWGNDTPFAG